MEWSPSQQRVVVRRGGGFSGGTRDLFTANLLVPPNILLDSTAASDRNGRAPTLSPDGRWLAYNLDDRIAVRSFPDGREVWLVSEPGAVEPLWSLEGSEIFFRTGDRHLVAAQVRVDSSFAVAAQDTLFDDSRYRREQNHRAYDVAGDGTRFLMIRVDEDPDRPIWVQGFARELGADGSH